MSGEETDTPSASPDTFFTPSSKTPRSTHADRIRSSSQRGRGEYGMSPTTPKSSTNTAMLARRLITQHLRTSTHMSPQRQQGRGGALCLPSPRPLTPSRSLTPHSTSGHVAGVTPNTRARNAAIVNAMAGVPSLTPSKIPLNPFEDPEEMVGRIDGEFCSPNMFRTTSHTPGQESEEEWTLHQQATLFPAKINDFQIQQDTLNLNWVEPELERRVQTMIDSYFTNNPVVPTPSPLERHARSRLVHTPGGRGDYTGSAVKPIVKLPLDDSPAVANSNDVGCQTNITLPVDFDLEAIIAREIPMSQQLMQHVQLALEEDLNISPSDSLSSSGMRRKLFHDDAPQATEACDMGDFGHGMDEDPPPFSGCAAENRGFSPMNQFSSSPIRGSHVTPRMRRCSTAPGDLHSPAISPIGERRFFDMSVESPCCRGTPSPGTAAPPDSPGLSPIVSSAHGVLFDAEEEDLSRMSALSPSPFSPEAFDQNPASLQLPSSDNYKGGVAVSAAADTGYSTWSTHSAASCDISRHSNITAQLAALHATSSNDSSSPPKPLPAYANSKSRSLTSSGFRGELSSDIERRRMEDDVSMFSHASCGLSDSSNAANNFVPYDSSSFQSSSMFHLDLSNKPRSSAVSSSWLERPKTAESLMPHNATDPFPAAKHVPHIATRGDYASMSDGWTVLASHSVTGVPRSAVSRRVDFEEDESVEELKKRFGQGAIIVKASTPSPNAASSEVLTEDQLARLLQQQTKR